MSGTRKDDAPCSPLSMTGYTVFQVRQSTELMRFLTERMKGAGRNKVKSLLAKKAVYVNQEMTTRYDFQLRPGMKVQIGNARGLKEFRSSVLKIVYEDACLIVIEKREGLLSVATSREKERTAHSVLNEYVRRSGRGHRVFIVHRLDRDTSGLMVFAKDVMTKRKLQDNWKEIVTDRRYVAVVSGYVRQDSGTIVSWIKDNKMHVSYSGMSDNGGDKAVTHYKVIKRANGYSLLELELETGRKNQIRVHMHDIRHPVIGDKKYGDGVNPIGRLGLHAFKLHFYHPVTGRLMKFETPCPSAFKGLLLKKGNNAGQY